MQFLATPIVDPGSNFGVLFWYPFGVHFGVLFWYPGGEHYGRETLLRGAPSTEDKKVEIMSQTRRNKKG